MKNFVVAIAFVAGLAGTAQAASITDTFTSFYSFGDSLSDDGKFGQLDPPSFEGRFSNGPVWAELIADEFIAAGRDTANLAQGGATAGNVNDTPIGPLSTFAGQVGTFANSLITGSPLLSRVLPTPEFVAPPTPDDNPLVSVWFGANDIFQSFTPDSAIAAANAVANGIRALNALDTAAFDDFLVVSLPDLGQIPAFAGAASSGATQVTNIFNAQLAANVFDLRNEGLNIIDFNPDTVFDAILDDISAGTFEFGILDAQTPCTLSVGAALDPNTSNPGSCVDLDVDPNTLLFVDAVHPNAVAHGLFADEVRGALEANISAVPVPATLPLLITVLAGFGVVARRRRS